MTTARERTQKALCDIADENLSMERWMHLPDDEFCEPFAIAASDVWEPLLRDLYEHHEHTEECGVWHAWSTRREDACSCGHDAAMERAREALE